MSDYLRAGIKELAKIALRDVDRCRETAELAKNAGSLSDFLEGYWRGKAAEAECYALILGRLLRGEPILEEGEHAGINHQA